MKVTLLGFLEIDHRGFFFMRKFSDLLGFLAIFPEYDCPLEMEAEYYPWLFLQWVLLKINPSGKC